MSVSKVRQCYRNLEAERTDVHDACILGRMRVSFDDLVQRVDQANRGNRRFTISVLSDSFPQNV